MAKCSCHVAACRKCDSPCVRCGCACNGISIEDNVERKRGYRQHNATLSPSITSAPVRQRSRRTSVQDDICYMETDEVAGIQEEPIKIHSKTPLQGVREALGLGPLVGRHLPSAAIRESKDWIDLSLAEKGPMINTLNIAMEHLAGILYKKDPSALTDAIINKPVDDSLCISIMKEMVKKLPPQSLQQAALLAVLCEVMTLDSLSEDNIVGKRGFISAKKNAVILRSGKNILPVKRHVKRYFPEKVQKTMRFILSDRNIQILSWGVKKVYIDGKAINIPKLARKKCISNMVKEYHIEYSHQNERVGDTSFRSIAKAITSHDTKARTSVDYVSGVLMYDNLSYMKQIVCTIIDPITKDLAVELLNILEACLKRYIPDHIRTNPCLWVNIDFALCRSNQSNSNMAPCNVCSMPFVIIDRLKRLVDSEYVEMLDDCMLKVKLFIAHCVRSHIQNKRCDQLKNELTQEQALIIIDYKMKFEPMYFREKSSQFYGKKGMSWHGSLLCTKCSIEDGETIPDTTEFDLHYFDHIVMCDTTQDSRAVLSIFESLIW